MNRSQSTKGRERKTRVEQQPGKMQVEVELPDLSNAADTEQPSLVNALQASLQNGLDSMQAKIGPAQHGRN